MLKITISQDFQKSSSKLLFVLYTNTVSFSEVYMS